MSFTTYYLRLEWKLLNRNRLATGFNLGIFWTIAPPILIGVMYYLAARSELGAWVLMAAATMALHPINARSKIEFLRSTLPQKEFIRIQIFRNFLLIQPVVLVYGFTFRWQQTLVLAAITLVNAFYQPPGILGVAIPTPYRGISFEFIAGFRRYGWFWLLLIPGFWLSYRYANPSLVLAAFGLILLTQVQYYQAKEPIWYVWNEAKTPNQFLAATCKHGIRCFFLSNSLFTLLIALLIPETSWMVGGMFLLGMLMLIFNIFCKYAYLPRELPALQGILFALNLFFPPLLLVSIPYFYRKAEQNLNPILL